LISYDGGKEEEGSRLTESRHTRENVDIAVDNGDRHPQFVTRD
jgi:hypothetical protein